MVSNDLQDNERAGNDARGHSVPDREELIGARRQRQQGPARANKKLIMSVAMICGGVLVFAIGFGSTGLKKIFGQNEDAQRASQVDMEVGRDRNHEVKLDFIVPAKPAPEVKEVDPNAALNEKFKAMQAQIVEMGKNRPSGVSNSEVQQLLARYTQTMTEKMEAQSKALAEENARLRDETTRAEALRRQLEEQSKLAETELKERRDLDKAQRESDAVIVDEGASAYAAIGQNGEMGPEGELNANQLFLKSAASSVVQTSVSTNLTDPSRTIVQGTIVSAVLETAIDTQLPGYLRAQVMEPVFSFDGSRILMPQGTILIGQFNNDVDIAQKRVLIAWNRAVTPDGKSVALGSTGTDRLGRSGTMGNVNNRYMTKFGAAAVISAITIAPSMIADSIGGKDSSSSGTTINIGGSGSSSGKGNGQALASSVGDSLGEQTSGVLEKYLNLPPVIRVPQGEEIRIFVNRDLVFR
jgi:type IV secretion system protein VirB10